MFILRDLFTGTKRFGELRRVIGSVSQKVLVVLLLFLSACAPKEDVPAVTAKEKPVTLAVATDLHYISPAICDNGETFCTMVEHSDGKAMLYIQEIMETFVAEMTQLQPDAVLLTGDLTLLGAKASHEDMAKLLEQLQTAGIQTLVIPGNHDLDSASALSFSGETYAPTEGVTAEEFVQLYAPFGFDQALSRDEASLSYVYAPRKDLRVLMLDTNAGAWCSVTEETMKWAERQLKAAKRAGAKVVAASHQNMDIHNPRFTWGYQIVGGDDLRALYETYGVLCNLSGHLHNQHIVDGAVPEVATSALSICPNQYGVITYDGETFSYETKELDVSGWAKEKGETDPNLLDFAAYSEEFMTAVNRDKTAQRLADSGLTEEEIALLADTIARLNTAYFSGGAFDLTPYAEGIALWRANGGSDHLESIAAEAAEEYRTLTVTAR